MSIGRCALRLTVGALFIGHGMQKLQGWFGGPGPEGTEEMMESLDLHPPRLQARAAGLAETVSGAMLAAGLLTPVAAAGIVGVMTTAIRKVHAPNGVWNANGGWEFNAVMIAAALALAEEPGPCAIDNRMGRATWGKRWVLGALAGGGLASMITTTYGERAAAVAKR